MQLSFFDDEKLRQQIIELIELLCSSRNNGFIKLEIIYKAIDRAYKIKEILK